MKSPKKNFIIDTVAFICFVFLVSTGVLLYYTLPPGSGHYNTIWQLDRHEWGDIHFWMAVGFLVVLSLHLVLHWRWIKSLIRGKKRKKSGYRASLGLVGLIALLAIAIAPILSPVEYSKKSNIEETGNSKKEHKDQKIQGVMTLFEVEQISGVPVEYIVRELQLPPNVSKERKLEWLKKEYGFKMEDVRQLVEKYRLKLESKKKNVQ